MSFFLLSAFLFGLIVGSFLNVLIYRLHRGRSLGGFSACPHCRHRLGAADLVPLVSFIFLRGQCRYCAKSISWQYPLVEFAGGLVFALLAWQRLRNNWSGAELAFEWLFAAILIVIFAFDFLYYLIPDSLVVAGAGAAFVYRLIPQFGFSLWDGLAGVGVVFGLFAFLYLVSGGTWIGLGDVKLGIFLGLLLGLTGALTMLLLAYVGGALVGIVMILLGRRTLKGVLPFGTFLSAATIAVMLWGKTLMSWYAGNFYF